MGIPKRHTAVYEIIGNVCRIRKSVLRRCFHCVFIELHRIDHTGKQRNAGCHRIDRVKYTFLIFLHILIVCKRQTLHRGQHPHKCAVDTPRLSAHKLCNIRILFLRHDRTSRTVRIIKLHKLILVRIPDNDLL